MTHQRDLGRREVRLLHLYTHCQFGMTPQDFQAKWNVSHAQMARICHCSIPTVDRWFSQGRHRRSPTPFHRKRLAEMDLFWDTYENIPQPLRQRLCPLQSSDGQDLSP